MIIDGGVTTSKSFMFIIINVYLNCVLKAKIFSIYTWFYFNIFFIHTHFSFSPNISN